MLFEKISISAIFLTAIAIIFLIYEYVYKFYSRLNLYPRGPMPLPIIGNCLMLRNFYNQHLSYFYKNLANKYGGAYTFWLATKPIVVIHDIILAKEAFNNNEFCDRFKPSLESRIKELFTGGHNIFGFMNNSDEYKQLRNLSAQSIRKFLSTDKMSQIAHSIVFETVSVMKQRESGDAFVPFHYIESIFIRLINEFTFGKKIPFDDRVIEQISFYFKSIQNNSIRLFVSDIIPIFKHFNNWTRVEKSSDSIVKEFRCWYKNYIKHCLSEDNFGNIGEALISCANAMRMKNLKNETNEYLSESNIIGTLIILFIGASDTSLNTFNWIMLLMAYYPEMQQKMRNEINDNIGNNKIVDLSDKEKCVYVNAFICETLRYRNVSPLSLAHMTSSDTVLGDNTIPKGTTIILNQFSILNDSRYWKNPDIFNPERFIDSEQNLLASKMLAFIPFGTGKRVCVGEKFAMNMLFFALTSLLQATDGMTFVLPDKQSTDLEPIKFGFILLPKIFRISLVTE